MTTNATVRKELASLEKMTTGDLRATILTHPCGFARPEILLWLAASGVPIDEEHVDTVCAAPHADALNLAIECTLASRFDECLFVEHDLLCWPKDLEDFWTVDGDGVCARYGSAEWWAKPERAFHLGLWRTRREVLEACGPPWAVEGEPGCLCQSLARRFRAASFTITVAGSVLHHRPACRAEVAAHTRAHAEAQAADPIPSR